MAITAGQVDLRELSKKKKEPLKDNESFALFDKIRREFHFKSDMNDFAELLEGIR